MFIFGLFLTWHSISTHAFPVIPFVLPDFTPFNWTAHGSYYATGTWSFSLVYPVTGAPSTTNPGYLALDDVNKQYAYQIQPPSGPLPYGVLQIGYPNGTYFTENVSRIFEIESNCRDIH
jgi:hypothetical protein